MNPVDLLDALRDSPRPSLVVPRDPGRPSSVALLPGSFDPVTVAHAALADAASRRADLVVLSYSVRTLPKEGGPPPPLLPERERVAVLAELCRRLPGTCLGLCSHGLLRDQVVAAAERFPGARLWLAVGSDKVLQLLDPKWYEDREAVLYDLFERASVLYAVREGEAEAVHSVLADQANERWRGRFERVDVPADVAGVSSSAVRARLARGEDVGDLVPPEAMAAIAATR